MGAVLIKLLGPLKPVRLLVWLSLGYAILFGTMAAFGLWFWLVVRCSLARVAPFALLQTVVAVVASVVFLGERATASLVVGALVCMAGVWLTQARPPARIPVRAVTASAVRRAV